MNSTTAFCKRCALVQAQKDTVAELEAYISSIEPSLKVKDAEYKRRLSLCERCPELTNGLCRQCGCFVLARAVKKAMHCPSPKNMW